MAHERDIERADATLRSGGLVAFPTETVYGLGADAENVAAVRRIFAVKGRPATHPLIVHLGAADDLDRWATDVPELAWKLARRFWPGPLTLVLRRSARVPLVVTGGLETVGLRVPDHAVALDMLRTFGGGVAAPSANRFGGVSPTAAEHVRADMGSLIDFVLDGGACRVGIESTIVDLSSVEPRILRPGGVSREDLERESGSPVPMGTDGSIRSPGQHSSHYAPRAEVVLVRPDELAARTRSYHEQGLRVGVITTEGITPATADTVVLSGSDVEVARRLYSALRDIGARVRAEVEAALCSKRGEAR